MQPEDPDTDVSFYGTLNHPYSLDKEDGIKAHFKWSQKHQLKSACIWDEALPKETMAEYQLKDACYILPLPLKDKDYQRASKLQNQILDELRAFDVEKLSSEPLPFELPSLLPQVAQENEEEMDYQSPH